MNILRLTITLLFGLFAFNQCKPEKKVNVEITLSDLNGDATNSLNSITKKTEGGKMTSSSNGVPNYEISHNYRIKDMKLYSDLVFKKKGYEDKSWSKEMAISENGEFVYAPFPGISMKVIVKGN